MKKFFGIYASSGDVQTAVDGGSLNKPYVAYMTGSDSLDYNGLNKDYERSYFTVEMTSDGILKTRNLDAYWRKNGGSWSENAEKISGDGMAVVAGDKFEFKSTAFIEYGYYSSFINVTSGTYKVYGNVLSLLYGDNFIGQTEVIYPMKYLFYQQSGLTDASNLILEADTLTYEAYSMMFENCSNLISGPSVLPATTLSQYSEYNRMFMGCSSLLNAPVISLTGTSSQCCKSMFQNCTSLTTGPDLLAATLANNCYIDMFKNCSSLNYLKCLAENFGTMPGNQIGNFLYNVSSTGTFVKKSGVTWTSDSIPAGWTVIEE